MNKIVITGYGAVTPIGNSVDEYWSNLIAGKCGISYITSFDTSNIPVKIAGEVKNFSAEERLPKTLLRKTDPVAQYAYAAAAEAIENSGLEIEPERTGLILGTALGGISSIANAQEQLTLSDKKAVGPTFLLKMLGNIAAANIAINYNIQGPSMTLSTACSSGGDAINLACMMLQSGEADTMLAVGADDSLCEILVSALAGAKALCTESDAPEKACRPFDVSRNGFVIGIGGAALVLETEEHAKKRNAVILAELCACANTNDAFHTTAPHPEGRGAYTAMKNALTKAGLTPDKIGYVNAHGTSTPKGDAVEAAALSALFGDTMPLVSSTKGATGHMMGAGGITEVIACIKAIETGIVPPTLNHMQSDENVNIDFVPLTARRADIDYAMSNAFGFGGQNSSVIVGKYK